MKDLESFVMKKVIPILILFLFCMLMIGVQIFIIVPTKEMRKKLKAPQVGQVGQASVSNEVSKPDH